MCIIALRRKPAIPGLTHAIVDLNEDAWHRAVARLRDVRLLTPPDLSAPDALDAHPLVCEWFGQRLEEASPEAWRAAHGRLYEHLRDTTREGKTPTLEDLAPLYQAIPHGCRAGRHPEALNEVYTSRICRRLADRDIEYYASKKLGAYGTNLATTSWFFENPYETPITTLTAADLAWMYSEAAFYLRSQGRFTEGLRAQRETLTMSREGKNWRDAAIQASNLSECELLAGEVSAAIATAEQSIAYADQSGNEFQMIVSRVSKADALHAAGQREEADRLLADAEQRQKKRQPAYPLLYSLPGYRHCDLAASES